MKGISTSLMTYKLMKIFKHIFSNNVYSHIWVEHNVEDMLSKNLVEVCLKKFELWRERKHVLRFP